MSKQRSWCERASSQEVLLGLLQLYPNPALVELAGQCGYDFLILDAEHGTLHERDFASAIDALVDTGVLALVRLAGHDIQAVNRYVEMGADAIVAPHVSTVDDARALASAVPTSSRASFIVLIESALGVQNVEAILAVKGIDGAFVGPNDLSASLGCPGDYNCPVYTQALARIEHAAMDVGGVLGTAPHGPYSVEALRARGHRALLLGTDRSLLRDAMCAQISQARSAQSGASL